MPEAAAKPISLSVVIPAFNEEARLGATLAKVRAYLEGRGEQGEILVVDDGSSDGTRAVAEEALAGYPHASILGDGTNHGKGAAVRTGMLAAQGELVLFSDADMSVPIAEYAALRAAHAAGADVAIGSRAVRGSRIEVHQPPHRELLGRAFNVFVRLTVMGGIRDTQCGFKSFRREVIQPIFSRQTIDRWGFDVEILYIARRLGYSIAEVPVVWRNDAASKVSAGIDGLRMLSEAREARRRHQHLTPADR